MHGPKLWPLVFSNELSGSMGATSLPAHALGADEVEIAPWGGGGIVRFGTFRGDDLRGRDGNDLLVSLTGDDSVRGGDGNDIILTGSGDDFADGGRGRDAMALGAGNDTAWGGAGNDLILGGAGDDRLQGEAGRDFIFGGSGVDVIDGGSGDDLILGGAGADVLQGGTGNDFIAGGYGDDVLHGGQGRDVMDPGNGFDTIVVEPDDWSSVQDTDLLLSPVEDLLLFELDSDVDAIRFTASAFARSPENTISGSLFTGAIIFDDGDKAGDADAEVVWEGSASDFEGAVTTAGLVDEIQVTALADMFGRVPSDELDVFGTLFITVEAENDRTFSYATDFRGQEGDFQFQFVSPNGSSVADFVWDDTGFAIASETVLAEDDLFTV